MSAVKVKNIEIGSGIPKICVANVGTTKEQILAFAADFKTQHMDLMEWRVDWFEGVNDFSQVEDVLNALAEVLGDTPILFTFRTSKEGGNAAISDEDYAELNIRAARTGLVDLVDVEIFTGDEIVREIIDGVHEAGAKVIASNHDFDKTPAKSDIIYRLRKMKDMGADIPKIAVMPQSRRDVLTLLSATEEAKTDYIDGPIITMSMAGTGAVSRLAGEVFGSDLTFGSGGKSSAPGQIPTADLYTALQIIHSSL